MPDQDNALHELIDAWYNLQVAHSGLDGACDSSKAHSEWYDALLEALIVYGRVLEQTKRSSDTGTTITTGDALE